MQTALDQFNDNMLRVRNLDAIVTSISGLTTAVIDLSDLLRAQIVLSVSALDHYVHEITRLGMIEIVEARRPQTLAFARFAISMESALLGFSSANASWLDNEIRTRHSYLSFQQPDRIAEAIRLFSSIELWNSVGARMATPPSDVKSRLALIVDRRNKIAHEADIDPSYPNTRWPITPQLARDTTSFIESVCHAIHHLVV